MLKSNFTSRREQLKIHGNLDVKFLPYCMQDIVREFDEPDKFQHMLWELESVRKQAYEEKCSRDKAERELLEAFQKVRVAYFSFNSHIKYC
jgi:CRISPR/Cas system-associated endonuclease/helicase Cas3